MFPDPGRHQLSTGVILANLLTIMLQSHDQSDAQALALSTANVAFTVIFAVELGLKLIIVGPGDFFEWGNGSVNMIDAFVVAVSLYELAYQVRQARRSVVWPARGRAWAHQILS